MGSIVVGCDGSPGAAEALRWAADEGEARGWSVTAVLAWDLLGQLARVPDEPAPRSVGEPEAMRELTRCLQDALGERAAGVHPLAVCDLPPRALLGAATTADLLVVGARGLGTVRGAVLGSVSQQCVLHSPVPVAVVRKATDPNASGIVVAIDGSAGSQRALDWALAEARVRVCKVKVVFAWHPMPVGGLGMPAAWGVPAQWPDTTGMQADAADLVDRALRQADARELAPSMIERRPVLGTAVDAILEEACDARLLVVGSRGRGGFARLMLGSVSQHLVHHATCPIVVVPALRK